MPKIPYYSWKECPVCHGSEYVRAKNRHDNKTIIKTCQLCRERTIANWKRWGRFEFGR